MNVDYEILRLFADKKIIAEEQIDGVISEAAALGVPVEEYLVKRGFCDEEAALAATGEFLNMPFARMETLDVDEGLLSRFNPAYLKAKKIVPVSLDENGVLLAACARPADFSALSCVSSVFSAETRLILVSSAQIDEFLDGKIAVNSAKEALESVNRDGHTAQNPVGGASDGVLNAPTVKFVDSVIGEAISLRASDIHVEPFDDYVVVRYRVDGRLVERTRFSKASYAAIAARLKIMADIDIAEHRIPQDGHINITVNGTEYDLRVSTLPTVHGEKFAVRILDKSAFSLSRTSLGFTPEANAAVDKMLACPHGIILMSGPTGCGKTTTLYSFLRELNKADINIVTVEDPVEYNMSGINQVSVNNKANLTFAAALRSIVRQDPDVIMIGEIRDEETARIAIRAAITGRLVLSTIHTGDAPEVVTRLVDMGVPRYLVADALIGVIAQRLVKKLCPVCRERSVTTEDEMKILELSEPAIIYRAKGCKFCGGSGYKGRTAVHEILRLDGDLRNAVARDISADMLRKEAKKSGMTSLWENCRDYVLSGITDMRELNALYDGKE